MFAEVIVARKPAPPQVGDIVKHAFLGDDLGTVVRTFINHAAEVSWGDGLVTGAYPFEELVVVQENSPRELQRVVPFVYRKIPVDSVEFTDQTSANER